MAGNPDLLSDEELKELWRSTYKGTHKEFCSSFGCNRGNFCSWISGKRHTSPASSAAVRRYLSQQQNDNWSKQQGSHLSKQLLHLSLHPSITSIGEEPNQLFSRNNGPTRNYITERELDEQILKRANELKAIVYLDGDNAAVHLDSLSVILSETQRGVMVVCVFAKDAHNTMALEMQEKCEWLFVHHALTSAKDATDQALVCLTMIHHALLRDRLDIPFLLVSRDRFLPEPKERLEGRGRKCFTANGFGVTPGMALLLLLGTSLQDFLSPLSKSLLDFKLLSSNSVEHLKEALRLVVERRDGVEVRVARKLLGFASDHLPRDPIPSTQPSNSILQ